MEAGLGRALHATLVLAWTTVIRRQQNNHRCTQGSSRDGVDVDVDVICLCVLVPEIRRFLSHGACPRSRAVAAGSLLCQTYRGHRPSPGLDVLHAERVWAMMQPDAGCNVW